VILAIRARRASWWPAAATLALGTAALGAALVIPYTFSDPNGVDPYVARISIVAVLLLIVAFLRRPLNPARPVLLALVAVTASFTLLAAGPQILADLFQNGAPSFAAEIFWASLAQFVLTAGLAVIACRLVRVELRPRLRMARFGPGAVAATVAGTVLLIGVAIALPASWLGRYGVQPVAGFRDLPWLWPANALQALSQELQFRGLLMGAMERVAGKGWANVAQAVFFGLAHLAVNYQGPVAPFVPVTIAVGLLLGWVVQRTNSLWPAVIVHAVADIAITVAVVPGLYGFS
jgi:membrane protease YdiL (CAAX protease family)